MVRRQADKIYLAYDPRGQKRWYFLIVFTKDFWIASEARRKNKNRLLSIVYIVATVQLLTALVGGAVYITYLILTEKNEVLRLEASAIACIGFIVFDFFASRYLTGYYQQHREYLEAAAGPTPRHSWVNLPADAANRYTAEIPAASAFEDEGLLTFAADILGQPAKLDSVVAKWRSEFDQAWCIDPQSETELERPPSEPSDPSKHPQ